MCKWEPQNWPATTASSNGVDIFTFPLPLARTTQPSRPSHKNGTKTSRPGDDRRLWERKKKDLVLFALGGVVPSLSRIRGRASTWPFLLSTWLYFWLIQTTTPSVNSSGRRRGRWLPERRFLWANLRKKNNTKMVNEILGKHFWDEWHFGFFEVFCWLKLFTEGSHKKVQIKQLVTMNCPVLGQIGLNQLEAKPVQKWNDAAKNWHEPRQNELSDIKLSPECTQVLKVAPVPTQPEEFMRLPRAGAEIAIFSFTTRWFFLPIFAAPSELSSLSRGTRWSSKAGASASETDTCAEFKSSLSDVLNACPDHFLAPIMKNETLS